MFVKQENVLIRALACGPKTLFGMRAKFLHSSDDGLLLVIFVVMNVN
jgi:hypothetical protein